MKKHTVQIFLIGLLLFALISVLGTAGCTEKKSGMDADIGELEQTMTKAEERLFSINWNLDNPGNIRAELMASEKDFKNVFDSLSAKQPSTQEESERLYSLRALSCSYIDMIAAMMDLANVFEHYNSANDYSALYEYYNWEIELRTADDALASARNNLYSANYRISGVNMNMVPLDLQGDITSFKVRIDEMEKILDNLASEFEEALS